MNITVFNADVIEDSQNGTHWVATIEVEGKGIFTFVAPLEIFETAAAEYGIDPEDMDTIAEIVLYRPYLPSELHDNQHPKFLYNAESIDEAREHMLASIREMRGKGQLSGASEASEPQLLGRGVARLAHSDNEDSLEFMKRVSPMDPDVVVAKRRVTEHHRRSIRAQRVQQRSQPRTTSTTTNFGRSKAERLADVAEQLRTSREDAERHRSERTAGYSGSHSGDGPAGSGPVRGGNRASAEQEAISTD